MRIKILEELLQERNVLATAHDLNLFLERLSPNGASVHSVSSTRAICLQQSILFKARKISESTRFKEYREIDRDRYEPLVAAISLAQEKFNYLV